MSFSPLSVVLGQTVYLDFCTNRADTGAESSATSVTVRVFEDANDTAILTPTATERTSQTGNYRVQIDCTEANGFERGKCYNVIVQATVNSVTGKGKAATLIVSDLTLATISADGGNTATTFKTDRTEATNDYWKDCLLVFRTGSLKGQVKKITGYSGSTKFVTVESAFTATPSASDAFVLINE